MLEREFAIAKLRCMDRDAIEQYLIPYLVACTHAYRMITMLSVECWIPTSYCTDSMAQNLQIFRSIPNHQAAISFAEMLINDAYQKQDDLLVLIDEMGMAALSTAMENAIASAND